MLKALKDVADAHRLARRRARVGRVLSKLAFEPAEKQPLRCHLFFDGERLTSALAIGEPGRIAWRAGPQLSPGDLSRVEALQQIFNSVRAADRDKVGIILHLADYLEAGIVQEQYENPELFVEAGEVIRERPHEVVTGLNEEVERTSQWRYYPLLGGNRAVTLNHRLDWLRSLEVLTEPPCNVRIAVRSAAVEMLSILLPAYQEASQARPHVLALFYDHFTVMIPLFRGVLNFHVLAHHQINRPPSFGDDLFALLEPLGFISGCNLVFVQCGTGDPSLLFDDLQNYVQQQPKNTEQLEVHLLHEPAVWDLCRQQAGKDFLRESVGRPEFLVDEPAFNTGRPELDLSLDPAVEPARWSLLARQSFWPEDRATRERQISRQLALTMVALRFAKLGFAMLLVLLIGILGWTWWSGRQTEAARLKPQDAQSIQRDLATLEGTKAYLVKWGGILTARSQAWSTMDFALALVPPSNNVVCNNLKYSFRQAESKEKKAGSAGWVREWTIEGMCDDRGSAYLQRLQESSALNQVFIQTQQRLQDTSFSPGGNRTLKALYREEANSAYDSKKGDAFPYAFRLVVSQTVPPDDPLALKPLTTKKGK